MNVATIAENPEYTFWTFLSSLGGSFSLFIATVTSWRPGSCYLPGIASVIYQLSILRIMYNDRFTV